MRTVLAVRWVADSNSLLWASGPDLFLASLAAEAGGGFGVSVGVACVRARYHLPSPIALLDALEAVAASA